MRENDWHSIFRTNFNKTGITAWGYGPPGETTKEMIDRGFVELEFQSEDTGLWRGVLTERGRKEREE